MNITQKINMITYKTNMIPYKINITNNTNKKQQQCLENQTKRN